MIHSEAVDDKLLSGFSQIHPDLYIGESGIEGKGIFSEVFLPKGTQVFDIVAEKISYKNDPSLAGENPNWIGSGFQEWLKVGPGDIASYLNHSCSPNVIINEQQQVVTIADVKGHEELRMDYSTTELDPYWQMECKCDSTECRRILRSFQFLPEELKLKYRPYLAPAFQSSSE
jgi:hypothetical protein